MLTRRRRLLPDFYILGAQKCGTSALAAYLSRHQCVHPPDSGTDRKETQFWTGKAFGPDSSAASVGRDLYRTFFPLAIVRWFYLCVLRHEAFLTFDATPAYLLLPFLPARFAACTPNAKMIVVLREPAARAISQYSFNRQRGGERSKLVREFSSMEAMLALESSDLARELWTRLETLPPDDPLPALASDGATSSATLLFNASLRRRGEYARQLEPWLAHFPRSRFLILSAEELRTSPQAVLDEVTAFLGISRLALPRLSASEANRTPTQAKVTVEPATRQHLAQHFAPHNEALAALLKGEFGWTEERLSAVVHAVD